MRTALRCPMARSANFGSPPAVMSGYWNDPAGTAETLVGTAGSAQATSPPATTRASSAARTGERDVRSRWLQRLPDGGRGRPARPSGRGRNRACSSPGSRHGRDGVAVIVPAIRARHRRSTISESTGRRRSPITNCRRRSVSSPNSRETQARQDRPARACRVEAEHPSTWRRRRPPPFSRRARCASRFRRLSSSSTSSRKKSYPHRGGRRYRSQPALRSRVPRCAQSRTGSARRVRRGSEDEIDSMFGLPEPERADSGRIEDQAGITGRQINSRAVVV